MKCDAAWRVSVSVNQSRAHICVGVEGAQASRQGVYLYSWFILTNSVLLTLLYTETISNYDVIQPVIIHRDSIEVSKGW